jgi:hypothetical protein
MSCLAVEVLSTIAHCFCIPLKWLDFSQKSAGVAMVSKVRKGYQKVIHKTLNLKDKAIKHSTKRFFSF